MILSAHGITVTLPRRWSGRIFRRAGGNATLHAGDFRLALGDGEFGDRSTGKMSAGAAFVALAEYLPGAGLAPGQGLFARGAISLPLDPTAFSARRLAHARPGQAGMQHFFTAAGRPFCLYVVIAVPRALADRRRQLVTVGAVLATLRWDPADGSAGTPV
ncbi:MAG: hypothetical protein ACR2NR_03020 [Solirubrobacteraceae bacterium]